MQKENKISSTIPFAMLSSRLILFLVFQAAIALFLSSWEASQKYWLLTATLVNLVCILLLYLLFKRENRKLINLFRFNRTSFRKDLLIFIGLTLLIGPIAFFPNNLLSIWLWGNAEVPFKMMFQPIGKSLAYFLLLVFPISIAFAELATYFGYIMPRIEKQLNNKWISILLPVLFLSIQHCALPFIPDIKFIIYRGLVFFPFALLLGISIHKRPSLFPYFAILHGIMDFGTAIMFVTL
jgi:membrane protease YdiL (CAAX protease family)